MVITSLVGSGMQDSCIYPIYVGIIVLTGVAVGAYQIII